jgi:HEAT repeat protein
MKAVFVFFTVLIGRGLWAQDPHPSVVNAKWQTQAFAGDLGRQLRSASADGSPAGSPAWFGYKIKTARGEHRNCCWNDGDAGCRLEGGSARGAIAAAVPTTPIPLEGSDALAVLLRISNDLVDKIQVFSLTCPLDGGGLPFVWISDVPAEASLSYLEKLAVDSGSSEKNRRAGETAVMAIAQHDIPLADAALDRLARSTQPEKLREPTIFWIGASRGAAGISTLKQVLAHDSSERIRDKAVFALSISKQPDALETLIQEAKSDSSAHVRGQALFWLAQKAGKRASATITDAIENDPDTGVKKRAVFALSQLPKDEGVPKLIEVARNQRNAEVRKQAFFWLGQSQDARALAFITEVLSR